MQSVWGKAGLDLTKLYGLLAALPALSTEALSCTGGGLEIRKSSDGGSGPKEMMKPANCTKPGPSPSDPGGKDWFSNLRSEDGAPTFSESERARRVAPELREL